MTGMTYLHQQISVLINRDSQIIATYYLEIIRSLSRLCSGNIYPNIWHISERRYYALLPGLKLVIL